MLEEKEDDDYESGKPKKKAKVVLLANLDILPNAPESSVDSMRNGDESRCMVSPVYSSFFHRTVYSEMLEYLETNQYMNLTETLPSSYHPTIYIPIHHIRTTLHTLAILVLVPYAHRAIVPARCYYQLLYYSTVQVPR